LEKFEVTHFYKSTFSDMVINEEDKSFVQYSNIFELYAKLAQAKPDLIQPLEPYYGYSRFGLPWRVLPIMLMVYIFCRIHKVPYFIHFLENISPGNKYYWPFSLIMKSVARLLTGSAGLLFYLNEGAKKNIKILGAIKKAKFGLWGIWGVNQEVFYPSQKPPKMKVLFVGRITEQKGVIDLLNAFSQVHKQLPSTQCIYVGSGDAMEQVRERSVELGLSQSVIFIGEIPDTQIAKFYREATLLVFPSKSSPHNAEQVGMVAIEAMSSGLPVVGYRSGSIGEFVKDQESGLLVREGDIDALANAIVEVLGNERLRRRLSWGAVNLASDKYDQKKNVKKLEKEVFTAFFGG